MTTDTITVCAICRDNPATLTAEIHEIDFDTRTDTNYSTDICTGCAAGGCRGGVWYGIEHLTDRQGSEG